MKGGGIMNVFMAVMATIQFLLTVGNRDIEARKMYCTMYLITICGVIINTALPLILK